MLIVRPKVSTCDFLNDPDDEEYWAHFDND